MNIATASQIIDDTFSTVVGQTFAKKRLKQILLGSLMEEGFMPPVFIAAPVGTGKTLFMRAIKSIIKALTPERRTIFFESGNEMGTPLAFVEDILVRHLPEAEVTMFVDEFHEAKSGIHGILRSLIDVTIERAPKRFKLKDYEVFFNPKRHSMVVATNKVDEIDSALMSRFERIDLELYSDEEMEQILFRALQSQGITFNENTLRRIAECNRGNARDVVKWADSIRAHVAVAGKRTINKKDVADIVKMRETFPLGVTKNELRTLLHLESAGPLQLKMLAARNMVSCGEQMSFESYLFKRGFLAIDVLRRLTKAGREYLAELRADEFIDTPAPAASAEIS
jgi:Holliday junction resolvasome RuvABC ATP-dependent DNA helicase subunit